MRKEKIAWITSLLLIGLLAFQLPGTLAQRDDDYDFVRTLVDIHRQVAQNYVEPVSENELRQGAINGMLEKLDPYSVYVPEKKREDFDRMLEGSFKGVGIQLDQLENGQIEVLSPIDGSPAFKAGVLAGDIILKVNGESLEGQRLPDVIKRITGPLGSEVTLQVKHATGEEAELTMKREEIIVPTVKGYTRKGDNAWDWYVADSPKVAYVRVTQFTPDTAGKLQQVLAGEAQKGQSGLLGEGMQGLILDLRFNPGGRLDEAEKMIDLFIDQGVMVKIKGRNRPETVRRATAEGTLPYFPMIVLVNEHSASASEIVAGSLMDNKRALVMGTRSYGKGSVQEVVPLEGKSGELKLTVAYYYLPSGRLVHRKKDATDWGVEPQIVVPVDPVAEQRAIKDRYEQELFRRPTTKSSTHPTTAAATTQPADMQLQRAVDTMIALIVFNHERNAPPTISSGTTRPAMALSTSPVEAPTSAPTTQPATQGAE